MSYSEIENEHHEAISGGIIALRNEVAKLTASAHNMRGQGLACDDPDRARALYESAAAYADAAQRVGTVANDFEQAESYRAGAMEAVGPVPTYDTLERELKTQTELAKASNNVVAGLQQHLLVMDAALGGNGTATYEEITTWVEGTAKALRRFRGIRDAAVNLLDKVGAQYSAHTLVDLLTILLDGDNPTTLAKFKAAVVQPEPLLKLPKISPELSEQIKRLAGSLALPDLGFKPVLDQLVTGRDVIDVDGEVITGRTVHVEDDFVNVQLAKHRADRGWYFTHVSLGRTELRPALPHEVNAFVRNLQLAKDENPGLMSDNVSVETEGEDATAPQVGQLSDTTPYVGQLENGGLFVGLYVGTTGQGRVKLQRPHKTGTETEDWGIRLEEVDPASVSPADAATAREFWALVDQSNAESVGEQPMPGTPEPSDIVIVTEGGVSQMAQFVGLDTDPLCAYVQVPEEASVGDGHVWAKRRVRGAALSKAAPHQVGEFLRELEAKGLDSVIR